jgi:hypothetical protein
MRHGNSRIFIIDQYGSHLRRRVKANFLPLAA